MAVSPGSAPVTCFKRNVLPGEVLCHENYTLGSCFLIKSIQPVSPGLFCWRLQTQRPKKPPPLFGWPVVDGSAVLLPGGKPD